jgi:microcompartment protein CcmK/EutM
MKLGLVVGTMVSTRKDASVTSLKVIVAENLTATLEKEAGHVVAGDSVGDAMREVILYDIGSSGPLP